ncbi:unnamed protein product, partial [Meganyctiphanes norvegica]
WQLPELNAADEVYEPYSMEVDEEAEPVLIKSDAVLYTVKEQDEEDGSFRIHSILKMMSKIPDSMQPKGNTPSKDLASNTFNLFMGDVSGSMSYFWPSVVKGWNTHVLPNLVGRTAIMTFGSDVKTKRSGYTMNCYEVNENDFDGTCTDLTGSLQAIVEEVYKCREKFINVFFVTDGGHNQTECQPDKTIEMVRAPECKICNVYVLGVGNNFPIQYSVNIRSRLHNGRANLPIIFWAKNDSNKDMEQKFKDIASHLGQPGSSNTIKLSIPGNILPFNSSQNIFHLNEYIYFDKDPEEIQDILFQVGRYKGIMHLDPQKADVDLYLNEVFRQWNGILIQLQSRREKIPPEIAPFMRRIFNPVMHEMKNATGTSIHSRLVSKKIKGCDVKFQTLMNKMKNIQTNERFSNEFELAEIILSTTVKSNKYAEKALCLKGHSLEEYEKDKIEFLRVIEQEKSNWMNIELNPDDCCTISNMSTLSDLKDEDLNRLLELGKYNFLKTFNISGIPIYSPHRDSVVINPWIYSIRRILKHPIVSHAVLEEKSTSESNSICKQHKGVKLQANDEETCCNAIIPVFPPTVATKMCFIMRTKIYAMCCSFAILNNPHMIDYDIHMATLGIVWVRILYENKEQPRPEYVQYRLKCIEATAAQYLDRPSFAKYCDQLKESPNKAIMTESSDGIDGITLKCESLIKPMFLLHMSVQAQLITDKTIIKNIVK